MTAKKITAPVVQHKTHKVADTDPPTSYAHKEWSADVVAAAGLRNGMTPVEVHAAIARVVDRK